MDFVDNLKAFAVRCTALIDRLETEEATKQSLVLPFLQLLGYNVFDPTEVVPEFTADVGTKKGEKVDYAIFRDGKPVILIEAKPVHDELAAHESQLFRYFSVTPAKFAILTNGKIYRFFSDLQEPNKMDLQPFLEVNLLKLNEAAITELKRFHKENFNVDDLSSAAVNLKYTTSIKNLLEAELREPSDDFLRFWLKGVYAGKLTQNVLAELRPIVKRALSQYINDLISDRLKSAMKNVEEETQKPEEPPATLEPDLDEEPERIVTTDEEFEAFYIVKGILRQSIDASRISYKDTKSYFGVLLDNNVRRWVCRLRLDGTRKVLFLHDDQMSRIELDSLDDIYGLEEQLLAIATELVDEKASA